MRSLLWFRYLLGFFLVYFLALVGVTLVVCFFGDCSFVGSFLIKLVLVLRFLCRFVPLGGLHFCLLSCVLLF